MTIAKILTPDDQIRRRALEDAREYVKRHKVSTKQIAPYGVRADGYVETVTVEMTPQEHFDAVYEAFLAIYKKANA